MAFGSKENGMGRSRTVELQKSIYYSSGKDAVLIISEKPEPLGWFVLPRH